LSFVPSAFVFAFGTPTAGCHADGGTVEYGIPAAVSAIRNAP